MARLVERDVYRLADSVTDLSCGILQQVVEVFLKTALFAGYAWLFAAHRLFDVPMDAAWAWAACFVGQDFLYYWFHRWSHEVGAGWAAHVVHHQSEEYNLTVALRQGALQPAFSWVFYLPLAVLGFPPAMFLAVSSFNTLYQFWIHTRLIGRLGPLEWVLNTPSHHRVHHGRNPRYIDRNHGGTLIVWDRLFGTFGARAGGAGLRRHAAARELEPGLGEPAPLGGDVGRGAAGAAPPRQGAGPLEAAGVAPRRPGRIRGADRGGPGEPRPLRRAGAPGGEALRAGPVRAGEPGRRGVPVREPPPSPRPAHPRGDRHRPEPASAWEGCWTGGPGPPGWRPPGSWRRPLAVLAVL